MPPPTTSRSKRWDVRSSRSRCMVRGRASRPGYIISVATIDDVRAYWERHIHDLEITAHPVGSPGFFADLDQYHFEKLHHLLRLVHLGGHPRPRGPGGGGGAGTDLVRFARGGAVVAGVDLSSAAIALARQ